MGTKFREFLSRVVPWPGEQPGYVNLHYTMQSKGAGGKPFWSGKPTRTIDAFIEQAAWALKQDFIKDIYFCTSLQSVMRLDKNKKEKPVRLQANVVALKAIWIDVDVKEPPKGYRTLGEALDAIGTFIQAANLPMPTALVGSGGGVHVYWISDRPLTIDEWRPYAEGLKTAALNFGLRCDAGCTIDSARVLRVPGTFNRKIDPPRPVKLLGIQETDYDFSQSLSVLASLAPAVVKEAAGPEWADKPSAAFAALAPESLAAGLQREDTPLDPKPIMKGCAFLRNALLTGGKDYDQPMWNLTTLAATFIEDGLQLAHKMGKSHAEYSPDTTVALWDRKNKERKDRGLGWPSCAAIQANGSKVCAACPHFKEKKSPLHLALARPAPAQQVLSELGQQAVISFMPDGFGVDKDGHICKIILKEQEEGPPVPVYTKIFMCRLSSPWAQKGPDALHFTTSVDKGHTRQVSITLEIIQGGGTELSKALGRAGIKTYPPGERYLREFLMSWITKLHEAQEATISVPFGWLTNQAKENEKMKRHGFVYGGLIMKDDGTDSPSGMGDIKLREEYQPVGDIEPWVTACQMVTAQKRPELDAIIAASFAAPLMVTPAEYAGCLSVWGSETGVGKTTALKVGLAVWAHPLLAKETTKSTSKSVIHKMGQIRNLPVYWDEIRNKKAQANVYDTFFSGSEGVGGGRLTSNIEQRGKGQWQTMLITCSNISLVDYVVADQRTTPAGMARVFEYHIARDLTAPGRIGFMDASRITQELENNYGMVGLKYARLLANSPDAADELTKAICENFGKIVKATEDERYWVSICGTILAGAGYANLFGAQIGIDKLTEFLKEKYQENRDRVVDEGTEGGTQRHTEEVLTGFLQTHVENTLFTDIFPAGQGRQKSVRIVFCPDPNRPRPIYVQWAQGDRKLRISRHKLVEYLTEQNISQFQVLKGLRDFFKAKTARAILGGGTQFRSGLQEQVIEMPIPVGSALEAAMLAHSPHDGTEDLQPAETAS